MNGGLARDDRFSLSSTDISPSLTFHSSARALPLPVHLPPHLPWPHPPGRPAMHRPPNPLIPRVIHKHRSGPLLHHLSITPTPTGLRETGEEVQVGLDEVRAMVRQEE